MSIQYMCIYANRVTRIDSCGEGKQNDAQEITSHTYHIVLIKAKNSPQGIVSASLTWFSLEHANSNLPCWFFMASPGNLSLT